jgi:dihydroorotate dehydrogenase (fumarate)
VDYFSTLNDALAKLMDRLSYDSVAAVSGVSLPLLEEAEKRGRFDFAFDPDRCSLCGRCVRSCPYRARRLDQREMSVDYASCRLCGLCVSVCPTGALRFGA